MGWKGARVFEQTLLEAYVWPCLKARVFEIFVPLSSIPCPKRDSLSRDARVLPLFSTPFVATNLEDINVDFVFVTRVTALARGRGFKSRALSLSTARVLEKRDTMQLRLDRDDG